MLKILFVKYFFMLYIFLFNWLSIFVPLFQSDKRLFRDYIDKYYSYSRFNPLKKWHKTFILFFTSLMFLQFYYLPINLILVC